EDGIRDFHVTGVQTCALPICSGARCPSAPCTTGRPPPPASSPATCADWAARTLTPSPSPAAAGEGRATTDAGRVRAPASPPTPRSEERRGGKEGRAAWSTI